MAELRLWRVWSKNLTPPLIGEVLLIVAYTEEDARGFAKSDHGNRDWRAELVGSFVEGNSWSMDDLK